MREQKNKRELKPDPIVYPWQSIQGDGETWLILRQRKMLDILEIKQLKDIALQEFTWTIALKQTGRSLYRGNIGFSIFYQEKNGNETDDRAVSAAPQEEDSCRRLYQTGKTISLANMKKRDITPSIFAGIMTDQIGSYDQSHKAADEAGICEIVIPWQTWLYGGGEAEDPQIVQVHLGQVGLKTILLEVVIKFQYKQDLRLVGFEKAKCTLLPKEEVLYSIEEGLIQKVIGVSVNRAFYAASIDPVTACLCLSYVKKTTFIFINTADGGEKILTASVLNDEQIKMTSIPAPPVPPVFYRCLTRAQDVMEIDCNRVLCKHEYLWVLDYKGDERREGEEKAAGENPSPPVQSAIVATMLPGVVPPRKKPGEKWQKKTGKTAEQKPQTKAGMVIKIVKYKQGMI